MYVDGNKIWYAILMSDDDTDHGFGDYNKRKALKMAREMNAYGVALVSDDDDYCYEIIKLGK